MFNIIVFTTFYKPHVGGVEKYVENFYKRLPNYKILVVTCKYEMNLKTTDLDENLEILRIPCIEVIKGKYFIPTITGIKQIAKIIKENPNSEIHTHTRFYLTNFIASILGKRNKSTLYHFEHGSSFVKDGSLFVRIFAYLFDKTFAKVILRNAELVFPISKSVEKFLQKQYKELKYGPVIYNSYEFKKEKLGKKNRPNALKLLFVGRIIKSKGIYELIEACKILKEKGFKYTLTVIGDGSEREKIQKLIKDYNLEKSITLRGQLPFEVTQKEYPKHDVLINPSYTEGLPTTVLEAVANGLIVIATDVGGTKEILGKMNLISLEKLNSVNLVIHIMNVYDSWDIISLKNRVSFEKIRVLFSWDDNVKKYLSVTSKIP